MKQVLIGLVCIVLGIFLGWMFAPGVWSDLRLDQAQLQPAPEYSIEKAECRQRFFILATCDLELTNRTSGAEVELDYLMLGRMGGTPIDVLKTADGGVVTSNVGLDYIFNRIIMLIAMVGILVVIGAGAIFAGLGGRDE